MLFVVLFFVFYCSADVLSTLNQLIELENEHRALISARLEAQKLVFYRLKDVPLHPSQNEDHGFSLFTIEGEISRLRNDIAEVDQVIDYYQRSLINVKNNPDFEPLYDLDFELESLKALLERRSNPIENINPKYIVNTTIVSNCTDEYDSDCFNTTMTDETISAFIVHEESVLEEKMEEPLVVDLKSDITLEKPNIADSSNKGFFRAIFDL